MPAFRSGLFQAVLLLSLLLPAAAVPAHDGHDHGPPAPAAAGPTVPMVEATGTDLEMAGLVRDGRLILWIDRFADNAPVTDATVEVGADGGAMLPAEARPDGTFALAAPWLAEPGSREVLVTVAAGDVADLLVGTLTIPADTAAAEAHDHGVPWAWVAGAFLAGALAAVGVVLVIRRPAPALTATTLMLALSTMPADGRAHDGHDHGPPAPAVASADAPRRQPDGSLFVPKRTQRLLEVRTVQAATGTAPRTLSAVGRVVADPNAAARVQASQSGRLEAPPEGLPYVGQRIEAGQVLGYVVPSVDTVARGDVQERLAEVEKELVIARRQVARLDKLSGVVADREIEDARALLAGLEKQRAALNPALIRREELIAPVSGILAASTAIPGLVIDDRDEVVLFDIVDPSSLLVEAVSFDLNGQAPSGEATAMMPDGKPLRLAFKGRGPALREGAAPLLFRVTEPPPGLAIGTPVRVEARVPGGVEGMALPREAVVRGDDGLHRVWVHTAPQRFEPRPVRFQALDPATVVVTAGLAEGDRVVTRAATLLNQIR